MRRLAVALCALALCAACSEPPQKEIERAQGALDAARAAGADQYASQTFNAATAALQQAQAAVAQNDYRLALSHALDANERALEAAKEAANGKARVRSEAEAALTQVTASLQQLQTRLKAAEAARLPPAQLAPRRRAAADAQRVLQEARTNVTNGNYLAARDALKDLPARIGTEMSAIDEAIAARGARGQRRRR
jgi:hypothetical protein